MFKAEDNSKFKKFFDGKVVLVTGGTGSFGHQITDELIKLRPKKIIVFSNDEDQLYHMGIDYKKHADLLDFRFGDVRDFKCMAEATKGVDIIYHAAALKHVPQYEFQPWEAIQTNILGAKSVRDAAIKNNVDRVIAIGTDKAVKPVNAMGMTKALQEKLMMASNGDRWNTKFICVRYGNVLCSRGSVVPFFKETIERKEPIPVTDMRMTRFLLTLPQAIGLVFHATQAGKGGDLFVRKMPACYIKDLAEVMSKNMTGRDDYPIFESGVRPGEKLHEVLVSEEEIRRAVESETYYTILPHGKIKKPELMSKIDEYASNTTYMMSKEELLALLRNEGWLK